MKFFQKYSQHFVQIVLSYFAFTSNTFVYTECINLHHFVDSDRTTSNMVICDSKSKTVTRCCRFLQKTSRFPKSMLSLHHLCTVYGLRMCDDKTVQHRETSYNDSRDREFS